MGDSQCKSKETPHIKGKDYGCSRLPNLDIICFGRFCGGPGYSHKPVEARHGDLKPCENIPKSVASQWKETASEHLAGWWYETLSMVGCSHQRYDWNKCQIPIDSRRLPTSMNKDNADHFKFASLLGVVVMYTGAIIQRFRSQQKDQHSQSEEQPTG